MLTCPNCGRESPDDFTFCPACGQPMTAATGRKVRKTVTVVFCDVTGSTAMGERLDPESLRDVQSRYFEAMRAPIPARHEANLVIPSLSRQLIPAFELFRPDLEPVG
jgi:hypothetical protein